MTHPWYEDLTWRRRQPLKYRTSGELIDSLVIYASTVTADAQLRKVLPAGQLLCKITSGDGINKYGPYAKTASDGRQTLAVSNAAVLIEPHDLAFGDETGGGVIAFASFDMSELTTSGVSLHGASLTSLKAAFPRCEFLD